MVFLLLSSRNPNVVNLPALLDPDTTQQREGVGSCHVNPCCNNLHLNQNSCRAAILCLPYNSLKHDCTSHMLLAHQQKKEEYLICVHLYTGCAEHVILGHFTDAVFETQKLFYLNYYKLLSISRKSDHDLRCGWPYYYTWFLVQATQLGTYSSIWQ